MRLHYIIPGVVVVIVVFVIAALFMMPSSKSKRTRYQPVDPTQIEANSAETSSLRNGAADGSEGSDDAVSAGGSEITGPQAMNQADTEGTDNPAVVINDGVTQSSTSEEIEDASATSAHTGDSTDAVMAQISGLVLNTYGKPVSGAAVDAVGVNSIVTGTDGKFSFNGITSETVSLTASMDGYQPVTKADIPVGTQNLVITLIQDGTLAGRVLDQKNDAVAFAKVSMKSTQGVWLQERITDAQGRFSVNSVPEAVILVQASQEGFKDEGEGTKEVAAPSPEEVILRLVQPLHSISGRVMNRETGNSVSNFHLIASKQDSEAEAKKILAQTDAAGMYKMTDLEPGTYLVSSNAALNESLNLTVPLDQDYKSVRVLERDATNVNFEVISGQQISGRVVNTANQPVSGAEVSLLRIPSTKTYSGMDGQFVLKGLPSLTAGEGAGSNNFGISGIELFASHEQYGTGVTEPLQTGSGAKLENVIIKLEGFATLSGTVTDQSGSPVPNAQLVLRDLTSGKQLEQQSQGNGTFSFNQVQSTALPEGAYQGTHQIDVIHPSYATLSERVNLPPGKETTIQLQLEGGNVIAGRVTDHQNIPLAGARATIHLPQGSTRSAVSDEFGAYRIEALPAGNYDVFFRLDSNPPLSETLYQVATGTTNADVVLQPGEWFITGTVMDAQTQQPLTSFSINVECKPSDPRGKPFSFARVINSSNGQYELTLTEPGQYHFQFLSEGYKPEERAQAIPSPMVIQYENPQLQPLQTTGGISGVFDPPAGYKLAAITVLGYKMYIMAGNEFLIESLPEGTAELLFWVVKENSSTVPQYVGVRSYPVKPNEILRVGTINPAMLTPFIE